MEETFKTIKYYENYSVSNFGNVMNNKTGRIFKPIEGKDGYFRVNLYANNIKSMYIHRLVAEAYLKNPEEKICVDHINNNKQNNTVENLRWATNSENCMNSKIPKNNTSGFKGVTFKNQQKKWHAQIRFNNKDIHIGSYTNIEEAITARQLKANELFGEFTNKCEKFIIDIEKVKEEIEHLLPKRNLIYKTEKEVMDEKLNIGVSNNCDYKIIEFNEDLENIGKNGIYILLINKN